MNLKDYLASLERGGPTRFASELQVSVSYLSQMASGQTSVSPARSVEIEQKTNGSVTRQELRPDDWPEIWPELTDKPSLNS